MSYVNAALRVLVDGLLYPFRGLPALVGLAVVSLVTAVVLLLAFKWLSNQDRMAEVKCGIHACLFEIRLFNDDLRAIMRALFEMLRRNLTYLRLSLVPMLWVLPPLVLIIGQMHFHYGYAGLEPGRTVLVQVQLDSDWKLSLPDRPERPPLTLKVPEGVEIEPPPVWAPVLNEMTWRVTATRPGEHELIVRFADQELSKSAFAAGPVVRTSPRRPSTSFWQQLLYPAEAPVPSDGAVESISIEYPESDVSVFGLDLHWMIVFFVLSIVFGFALRNRLGVTI